MIVLENVKKSFKSNVLFHNINVQFPSGSKILIKGVNGIGKSILLKMVVGYSKPDSGRILIDQFELGKNGDFIPDAGVSINAPEFLKYWTGMENLLYLAGIRKRVSKEEIMVLVKKLGLEDGIHKKYRTYSLGMRQKLRIIQALMEKPKYLILDEPFDALDKSSKAIVMQLLDEYMQEHPDCTFLYTSHNDAMESFADCIYEIDDRDIVPLEVLKPESTMPQ